MCVTGELMWQWCMSSVAAAKGVEMIVHDGEQFVQWERINEEEPHLFNPSRMVENKSMMLQWHLEAKLSSTSFSKGFSF